MPLPRPLYVPLALGACLLLLAGCGTDAFRISNIAPENLSETYVSAQYGAAGGAAYSDFRSGQIGCPGLARQGWSDADLFAVGCPAN